MSFRNNPVSPVSSVILRHKHLSYRGLTAVSKGQTSELDTAVKPRYDKLELWDDKLELWDDKLELWDDNLKPRYDKLELWDDNLKPRYDKLKLWYDKLKLWYDKLKAAV